MNPVWFWLGALGLYGLFSAWYVGWGGPLWPEEIDAHMARLAASGEGIDDERRAAIRRFLEGDDGREFFMVNLARLPGAPVADPETAEPRPAPELLQRYTRPFMTKLFRRAGHPAFFGRAAGGYVEHWGVEPDPAWSFAGVIRYRSRRDMIELATHPDFAGIHAYKLAAMTNTLAFPVSPGLTLLGPRVWMALLLGLVAALAHLAFGARS